MSDFLVDTNVISEFVKPQPNQQVISWLESADPESLFASVITVGELRLGIEDMPIGRKRSDLEQWLEIGLPDWFESNLLPVTKRIADRWARLTIDGKRRGLSIATSDGLITATALEHNLTIATRNVKDFDGFGARILNPWDLPQLPAH